MCISGINHTSNGYYSAVMSMSTILCQRQIREKPKEAYYRRFEAAIPVDEVEKCNTTPHMESNKSYAYGDGEDGTKRFQ